MMLVVIKSGAVLFFHSPSNGNSIGLQNYSWVMVMGLWLNTKATMLCKNRYVLSANTGGITEKFLGFKENPAAHDMRDQK